MKNKRILIKLSGQALAGTEQNKKYSETMLQNIADQLLELKKQNVEIALVVGGGNLFRGRDMATLSFVKRVSADYIGMLATIQNSLVLRDCLVSREIDVVVSSSIGIRRVCEEVMPEKVEKKMKKGTIMIFAAGLGAPYFSTDSNAVERSLEIGADMLVMAKYGVDGVYTADPKTDSSAKKIDRMTCSEVLVQNLKVADASAVALAREHNLPIKVVSMDNIKNLFDENVGSVISPK